MVSVPTDQLASVLRNGETVLACVPAGGLFAANHDLDSSGPHVLITDQRICFLSQKGMIKKRLEQQVSWPLAGFTSRINTSEGTALGPFMYFTTLFAQDGETVSAAFKDRAERDSYESLVSNALAPLV